jgi:hypothetical protein
MREFIEVKVCLHKVQYRGLLISYTDIGVVKSPYPAGSTLPRSVCNERDTFLGAFSIGFNSASLSFSSDSTKSPVDCGEPGSPVECTSATGTVTGRVVCDSTGSTAAGGASWWVVSPRNNSDTTSEGLWYDLIYIIFEKCLINLVVSTLNMVTLVEGEERFIGEGRGKKRQWPRLRNRRH